MIANNPIFLIKIGLQQFLLVLIIEVMDLYAVDGCGLVILSGLLRMLL